MLVAGAINEAPRDVAGRLAADLTERLGDSAERVEVAGPGFLNLFLSGSWYSEALGALTRPGGLPIGPVDSPMRILVEFVSANPTGPLTAAGGRHAAYGDSVARMLAATGHEVQREYYVNDQGGQIDRLAASVSARMTGADLPEDGYEGDYVAELAADAEREGLSPDDIDGLGQFAVARMLESIRETLNRYGVPEQHFFSERDLHDRGLVSEALGVLGDAGSTYESDGALWLRSSAFGDDKDRVLVRSGGEPTYLAADVAYHRDKLTRTDHMLNVLGADHHGYVERMKAAVGALGAAPDSFEAQIIQLVQIIERGQRTQMSKRRGDFVTLDDLIADIGVDAARFFMLQRSHDTAVDLDLDLARRQSSDNPVYYVQYAHARIASILRRGEELGPTTGSGPAELSEPAERELVKRLLQFPAEIHEAAARRAPHRLCTYATAIAADFHAFYRDCQVIGADGEGVQDARLALCRATKESIAEVLALLGISAPDQM